VLCKYIYFDMCWFNRLYIYIILRITHRIREYHVFKTQFGNRIATNKNLQGWIKPAAKWKALESRAWGTGKNTKSRRWKEKISSIQKRLLTKLVLFAPWAEKSNHVKPQSNYPKKSNENKPSVHSVQMTEIRGTLIGK
jgi:hypothetical protein